MKYVLLIFSFVLISSETFAKDYVAAINMIKAIQSTEDGKKAQLKLSTEVDKEKKRLEAEEAKIMAERNALEVKKPILSQEKFTEEYRRLEALIFNYQEEVKESHKKLKELEASLTNPILERMKLVIKEFSLKKGIVLVVDTEEAYFVYSKRDLTNWFVKLYNDKYGMKK